MLLVGEFPSVLCSVLLKLNLIIYICFREVLWKEGGHAEPETNENVNLRSTKNFEI